MTPQQLQLKIDIGKPLGPDELQARIDSGRTMSQMEEKTWMQKHPTLYGIAGAGWEIPKTLVPYLKYVDPSERERFGKLATQKQTRELLLQNLEAVAIAGTAGISTGAKALFKAYLPKTYKALSKVAQLRLGRKVKPTVAPKPIPKVTPISTEKLTTEEFYKPGNVIWDSYWRKYDKVLSFERASAKKPWRVKVQEVNKEGKLIGEPRWHSTRPSKGDKIVKEIETLMPTPKPVTEAVTPDDPIQKVIVAIKEAGSKRKVQELLYTQERRKRVAKAIKAGEKLKGEARFRAKTAALKGEMQKVEFESIKSKIGQKDIDDLFNLIEEKLPDFYHQETAGRGLAKLFGELGGAVPQESELKLLRQVFPADFIKTLLSKRPLMKRMKELGYEAINVPRAIMASFDLSAPLRQGIFLAPKHPVRFAQAFLKMFKQFGSEKAYRATQEALTQKKWYNLLREKGLQITEIGGPLAAREEAFMGANLAEKIPLIGRGVRASNRAYTGFLNKLRVDVGNDLVEKAFKVGLNPENNPVLTKAISKFVNAGTGRGGLGPFQDAAILLNSIFFSPRLMGSRLTLLNPVYYVKQPAFVRKEALKSLFTFAGAVGTTLGLADMVPGIRVGKDPRSADFLKIIIGNTRIDIMGGFQQYIRSAGQLISGKYVSSTTGKEYTLGEGYKPLTKGGIILKQVESKLAPPASFSVALMKGKDIAGKDISIPKEVGKRFVPMVMQDVYDLAKEDPELLPLSVFGIFGVGLQTYGPRTSISGGIEGIEGL